MELALFIVVGAVSLLCAWQMIRQQDPVHSALFLVATFFCLSILYVLLRAPLLAVLEVMVYAGAIMVLFVFVIMLFGVEQRSDLEPDPLSGMRPMAYLFSLGLAAMLIYVFTTSKANGPIGTLTADEMVNNHAALIGTAIFSQYLLPFEITSILLLVGMVGAIVLAKRRFD